MRRFHSYGPVDCEEHFCVERRDLIARCTEQLIGRPEKEGHYFTIWAPRQTGKTWLMRQVKKEIENTCEGKFTVLWLSMQDLIMEEDDPDTVFFNYVSLLFRKSSKLKPAAPDGWDGWNHLFSVDAGMFDRPLILFMDEFDSLPSKIVDRLVTLFRDMYLNRERFLLHGLALIGAHAVLGVESDRGIPFNVQRSLRIPNFTEEEVQDLFRQYQEESGQGIEAEVVDKVYEATRGHPGLVCWFGCLRDPIWICLLCFSGTRPT